MISFDGAMATWLSAVSYSPYGATSGWSLPERFRGVPDHPYEQGFDVRNVPHKLAEPLKWTRPSMVFVNSMSDLFQVDVDDAYIRSVADVNSSTAQIVAVRDAGNVQLQFASQKFAQPVGAGFRITMQSDNDNAVVIFR